MSACRRTDWQNLPLQKQNLFFELFQALAIISIRYLVELSMLCKNHNIDSVILVFFSHMIVDTSPNHPHYFYLDRPKIVKFKDLAAKH